MKPATPALNRIGRFHILRELGRGSIGSVYLAHDPIIDRNVAIKSFNPKLSSLEKKKHEQQFINEARAAGRLSHPHIVTIFDACNEGGISYVAMEYLQGRELSRMMGTGHPFRIKEIASIIWKIADALNYAHVNGVVHRDIKPANIFMVGDNQPKVVDFGIARAPNRVADASAGEDDAPFTLFHNNLLGTPTYMSPEQAAGRAADSRTDIYSLGAVMYEMLAGRKPFQSRDTDKLLQMIAYKAPPAPHEVNPKIPVALSEIVMRAMHKQPDKRYQHAGDMALDIKRYLVKGKRAQQQVAIPIEVDEENDNDPSSETPLYRNKIVWIVLLSAVCASIAAVLRFPALIGLKLPW